MNKDKRLLITYLIELNLLLDLFLMDNMNTKNKLKDLIILLYEVDPQGSYNKLLNYSRADLKKFIDLNLKNLLEGA